MSSSRQNDAMSPLTIHQLFPLLCQSPTILPMKHLNSHLSSLQVLSFLPRKHAQNGVLFFLGFWGVANQS